MLLDVGLHLCLSELDQPMDDGVWVGGMCIIEQSKAIDTIDL